MTTVPLRFLSILVGLLLVAPGVAAAKVPPAPSLLGTKQMGVCIDGPIPPDPRDGVPNYQVGTDCGPRDTVRVDAGILLVNATVYELGDPYLVSGGVQTCRSSWALGDKCPKYGIYMDL